MPSDNRRHRRGWSQLVGLLALLAGCGGDMGPSAPDDDDPGGGGGGGGGGGPAPVTFTASGDAGRSATKEIAAAGGVITVTGSDGTVFTLNIPKGALRSAVQITLTPIQSVSGFPWQGFDAGVVFAPEGLRFVLPATLTVVRAAAPDPQTVTAFAFNGQGAAFHMYPIKAVSGNTLELEVSHFSGTGFGRATPAQRSTQLQRTQDSGDAAVEQVRAQAERRRSGCFGAGCPTGEPEVTMQQVDAALTMLAIELSNALDRVRPGQPCGVESFDGIMAADRWIRATGRLGAAMGASVPGDAILQQVDAAFRASAAVAIRNCIEEDYGKCFVPGSRMTDWLAPLNLLTNTWTPLSNELQLPSMAQHSTQRARDCLTFDIKVDSRLVTTIGDFTTEATAHMAEAKVILDPRTGAASLGLYTSTGPADSNVGFTGLLAYGGPCDPSLQAGSGITASIDLEYSIAGEEDEISVAIVPTQPENHTLTLTCDGHRNPPIPFAVWAPAWLEISRTLPGFDDEGRPYVQLEEGDVTGGSPFAKKTLRRKVMEGQSTWQEDETVVTIRHPRIQ